MANEPPIAADLLRNIVENVRSLEAAIAEVYAGAAEQGFDVKVIKRMIRDLRQDRHDRQEFAAILNVYMTAIGED